MSIFISLAAHKIDRFATWVWILKKTQQIRTVDVLCVHKAWSRYALFGFTHEYKYKLECYTPSSNPIPPLYLPSPSACFTRREYCGFPTYLSSEPSRSYQHDHIYNLQQQISSITAPSLTKTLLSSSPPHFPFNISYLSLIIIRGLCGYCYS